MPLDTNNDDLSVFERLARHLTVIRGHLDESDPTCPGCGADPGDPPYRLAPGQHWCPDDDCRVKTFMSESPRDRRRRATAARD